MSREAIVGNSDKGFYDQAYNSNGAIITNRIMYRNGQWISGEIGTVPDNIDWYNI